MTAPTRGFRWARYVDDTGAPWALRVDRQYFEMPERGWTDTDVDQLVPFPRGWLTRKVRGVDVLGNIRLAVVASTSAPLWTGESTGFTIEADDGTLVALAVFGSLEEVRRYPIAD